jgi:DNA-binding IclR family transcriptional regulator
VARALAMLDLLRSKDAVTIGELSEIHGVHRATTLRLLQTLEQFGYVTRGRSRGEFRLGLKAFELGAMYSDRCELLRAARPMMRHLASTTGETIDLAIVDKGEVLLIESVAARPHSRVGSNVGRRVGITCTTTGKVHLAALPPPEAESEVAARGLPRMGPKSITDAKRFLAEIARVRELGYAVNDEETDCGIRFVGVPIELPDHGTRACLILGAPKQRLGPDAYPRVARLLRDAARCIADVA